jgi:hypothetical protein
MLSLLKRRADELMERRRQDVRDQAEELAPSMAVSQYLGPWARVGTKLYKGCQGLNIIEKAQFIALFRCLNTEVPSRGSSSHSHCVSLGPQDVLAHNFAGFNDCSYGKVPQ